MAPDLPLVTVAASLPAQSGSNINNILQLADNNSNNIVPDVKWQDVLQALIPGPDQPVAPAAINTSGPAVPEIAGQCLAAPGKDLPEIVLPDSRIKSAIAADEEPVSTDPGQDMVWPIPPAIQPPQPPVCAITVLREQIKELPEAFTRVAWQNSGVDTPLKNEPNVAPPIPVVATTNPDSPPVTSIPIIALPATITGTARQVQLLAGSDSITAAGSDESGDQIIRSLSEMNTLEEAPIRMPELRPVRTENVAPIVPHSANTVTPRWQQALGERVIWQVRNEITTAQIRLDPPDLGPLQVNVRLHNEHASVQFITHSADVKDAITASLSILRDQFVQSGIRMADVSVDWQAGQRGDQQSFQGTGGSTAKTDELSLHEELPRIRMSIHNGLIDCYV